MPSAPIPFAEIETLFLDVGNTLISMDLPWLQQRLASRGIEASVEEMARAEAAARPVVSARLGELGGTEGEPLFRFYFRACLAGLPAAADLGEERLDVLADELVPALRGPGMSQRLWSAVMPGVPGALAALKAAGYPLLVVSNADGTVEASLVDAGLRPYLDAVLDSHVVGFEKPDPRIFERALEASGADPARTLHVGDLYHADVVGARAAGLHALLLDPYGDWDGIDCPRLPDVPALAVRLLAARFPDRS